MESLPTARFGANFIVLQQNFLLSSSVFQKGLWPTTTKELTKDNIMGDLNEMGDKKGETQKALLLTFATSLKQNAIKVTPSSRKCLPIMKNSSKHKPAGGFQSFFF